MPIHLGTPMDENPPAAEPIMIFMATYEDYEDLAQLPKQLFIMNSECPRRTS